MARQYYRHYDPELMQADCYWTDLDGTEEYVAGPRPLFVRVDDTDQLPEGYEWVNPYDALYAPLFPLTLEQAMSVEEDLQLNPDSRAGL